MTKSTLTFITESLPAFPVNQPQQFAIEADGGMPPYSFQITQGELPASLGMDEYGTISGTVSAVVPDSTITVEVTDTDGTSVSQDFDVHVSKKAHHHDEDEGEDEDEDLT